MAKVLRSYGILDKLVNEIHGSYDNTIAKIYSPDGISKDFDIVAGVIQGATLSHYMFIIVFCRVCTKKSNQ